MMTTEHVSVSAVTRIRLESFYFRHFQEPKLPRGTYGSAEAGVGCRRL